MESNIWDDVDPNAQDAQSLSLPTVFWLNGSTKLKGNNDVTYTGGLFLTYEAIGRDDIEVPNWKQSSFVGDNGKDIAGIATNQAYISIVRYRRRWFFKKDGKTSFRPWRSDYIKGYRGQMQAVGFIRGLDEPVCFSFKGNAMKNLLAVLSEHSRKIVTVVNRKAPQGKPGLPPYAVWMPIKSGPHEKVGQGGDQSEVTLPIIGIGNSVTEEWAMKCVVSRDQLRQFQSLYKEAEGWAKEWETGGADERAPQESENDSNPFGDDEFEQKQARGRAAFDAQAPSDPFSEALEPDAESIPF